MGIIAATGNYNYFNLLTALLVLPVYYNSLQLCETPRSPSHGGRLWNILLLLGAVALSGAGVYGVSKLWMIGSRTAWAHAWWVTLVQSSTRLSLVLYSAAGVVALTKLKRSLGSVVLVVIAVLLLSASYSSFKRVDHTLPNLPEHLQNTVPNPSCSNL